MNKRNYFIFILCFTLFMVEFLFPQTTNIEQRFNDRYKDIESDEILSDSYASYNIINLDSFIVAKMNQYHIPGLAASIVKDGEIYWTGAFGFANIEDSVEVTDSTLFMLASTSKTVVGVALMQLWEKGLFELDDDINNYLPFEVHNPFFPDSIITIRMLLTHTSSINDNWSEMPYLIGDSPITERQYLEDYLVPGGAYYHTSNYNNFRPGRTWDYSNVAVALAAFIVEEIVGSFSLYCQDSIFFPLNMHETSWFLAELDTTHIARPYNYIGGGNYYPLAHYGYSGYPAGQLRTSTLQLSKFLSAFMQGGEINNIRILGSSTISLMTTVQFSQIDATQGLIWYKLLLNSRWMWGHGGGDKGVGSAMFYSPAENVGVICLCNVNARAFLQVMVDALFNYVGPVNVEDEISLPINYRLSQNYPNPFNPSTIIKYSIPKQGNVTLKVFDVLGKEITTLVDKEQPQGYFEIEFDGSKLTSGIYFYQLITAASTGSATGNFVETKKMILLK